MSPRVDLKAQELSHRDRTLLRAVAAGRAEVSCSREPVILVDGCFCCDPFAAGRLTRAGLLAAGSGPIGSRVPAELTPEGRMALSTGGSAAA